MQTGHRLAFLHIQQIIEGMGHRRWQVLGQPGDDVLAGLLLLLADDTPERRLGGEEDVPFAEELTGACEQRLGVLQACRLLEEEVFHRLSLFWTKEDQTQALTNAGLMDRDRVLRCRVLTDSLRVDPQLQRHEVQHLVADLQRLLSGEAVEQADEADLVGEAEVVVVAAALSNLGQVGFGQGRFPDQLRTGERQVCRRQDHQTRKTVVILDNN